MDKKVYEPIELYKIFKLNRSGDYEIASIESNLMIKKHEILEELPIEKHMIFFDYEELLRDYEREVILEVINFIFEFLNIK